MKTYESIPAIIDPDALDEYTCGGIKDLIAGWYQDQGGGSSMVLLEDASFYDAFSYMSSVSGLIDQILLEPYQNQLMVVSLLFLKKLDVWDIVGIYELSARNDLELNDFTYLKFNTNGRLITSQSGPRSRAYLKLQDQITKQNMHDVSDLYVQYREMKRRNGKSFTYLEPFIALLATGKNRNHFIEVMKHVIQLDFDVSYHELLDLFDHCADNVDYPVGWMIHLKKAETLQS